MNGDPSESALNLLFNHRIYAPEESENSEAEATAELTSNHRATEADTPLPEPVKIEHLGANNKGVFMVFAGGNMTEWPKDLKHVFMKILGSIGLEFNDIACLGWSDLQEHNLKNIQEQLQLKHMMLWGVNPKELGQEMKAFETKEVSNMQLTALPKLVDINADVSLKRSLWETIKKMDF